MPSIDPLHRLSQGNVINERALGGFRLVESVYGPDSTLVSHAHSVSKVSLILTGGTLERHRRHEGRFAAGCVVVKPKGAGHANEISPSGLRSLVLSCEDARAPMFAEWTRATRQYRWADSKSLARSLFDLYSWVLNADVPDAELRLFDQLSTILPMLTAVSDTPRVTPSWLRNLRDYLHENATRQVSLSHLAENVGVHPVYLARVFRRHFGCSMTDYMARQRVRQAAALLAESNRPASMIAQDAGFADQAHLCRVFKAHTGVSPGRYRRSFGGTSMPVR